MRVTELKKENVVLIPCCEIAESFEHRFLGLMGRKEIVAEKALVFPRCNSVHTFFMRMPIDVIFVSESGIVKEVLESLGPWRMLLPRSGVRHTVEMQAERAKALGIRAGDKLYCKGVWG